MNFGYNNPRDRRNGYNDASVPLPQPRPQGGDYDGQDGWGEEEEVEVECPLCLEPMDETDRTFFPCPCGYQLCLYCFNRVKDQNDKCPACRTKFNSDDYKYVAPEELPRPRSTRTAAVDNEQLAAQLAAQAEARTRAMEVQARRCGACQVEGPPLEPDPSYAAPAPAPAPAPTGAPLSAAAEAKLRDDEMRRLIQQVPTEKAKAFAFEIDWDIVHQNGIIEKKLRPWVRKKVTEYLGAEEQGMIEFIMRKVSGHTPPATILAELEGFIDEEAENFTLKMWRMLIFEVLRCKAR